MDDKAQLLIEKASWYLQPGNFYAFSKDVLKRDLLIQPHQEMASVAEHVIRSMYRYFVEGHLPSEDEKHHYLSLSPRGTYKSTVWNQCMIIYLILLYPNIRVLIDSETVTKSEVFLGDIRDQLETNQTFIALYGELESDTWNNSKILVNTRTRSGLKEATVMTGGVGKSMPGMHYDLIVGDDYVSDQNVGTFEQILKVINHIQRAQSLLDPGAIHFILGTRWTFDDPYNWIIENLSENFHIYIRSCGGKHDGDKSLYFPSRLTESFLGTLRKSQGSYIFSCQYRNFPIPDGEQTFDIKKYEVISKHHFLSLIKGTPYRWYYLVDPALTEEKVRRGDYTAISPYVILPDGKIYLYRAKAVREGVDKIIDTLYNHYVSVKSDLGPSHNGSAHIEAIAFQKLLIPLLKQKEKTHNTKILWKEMKTESASSKEVRIRAAVPWLEEGSLVIVQDTQSANPTINSLTGANQVLLDQAAHFPMAKNDDMIDNQGFAVHICKKPRHNAPIAKPGNWDEKLGVHPTRKSGTMNKHRPAEEFDQEDYNPNDYEWDVF